MHPTPVLQPRPLIRRHERWVPIRFTFLTQRCEGNVVSVPLNQKGSPFARHFADGAGRQFHFHFSTRLRFGWEGTTVDDSWALCDFPEREDVFLSFDHRLGQLDAFEQAQAKVKTREDSRLPDCKHWRVCDRNCLPSFFWNGWMFNFSPLEWGAR